jgi:hypothetical protein
MKWKEAAAAAAVMIYLGLLSAATLHVFIEAVTR